jgi:hypothetical protein
MFKSILVIIVLIMYMILGSFFENNHIIIKPAWWSLYGVVFGSIWLSILWYDFK